MTNYFLRTIQQLREKEEVILYENLLHFSAAQQEDVIQYLQSEYQSESLNYSHIPPSFDRVSALWAAQTVYISAQLILYRSTKATDLETILPSYKEAVTSSAFLSADITLRFLPDIINQLKAIDPSDMLAGTLENILHTWHYSAIQYKLPVDQLNFDPVIDDLCLQQMYIDRVIKYKSAALSNHPAIINKVKAALGLHTDVFWSGFKEQQITYEQH